MPYSNEFSKASENQASFARRIYYYSKERFPLFGNGLLIASFCFSAISYSRICRQTEGFVSTTTYLTGAFMTISLFLLVRIFDDLKDADDDILYRKKLPVPRGLVSKSELSTLAIHILILQVVVNLYFFPKMMLLYLAVISYLFLMGKEFFISNWLKKHQFWYVTSHMVIIPLIDIYASGLDWFLEDVVAPQGLIFFILVSYLNGVVIEVGRKIRTPSQEEFGVQTYTSMLGASKGVILWIAMLLATYLMSLIAISYAGYGLPTYYSITTVMFLCTIPGLLFLFRPTEKRSKIIELMSGIWTVVMYLTLGGIPMLKEIVIPIL